MIRVNQVTLMMMMMDVAMVERNEEEVLLLSKIHCPLYVWLFPSIHPIRPSIFC